jgi:flagellar assembly factor FliW
MEKTEIHQDNGSKVEKKKAIFFPDGLPAFETIHEFEIISNSEEAPFLWLQAINNPNLAFITIDPFIVHPKYRPDISDADVKALKIENEEDVLIMSIVNIHSTQDQGITANLVSPVVINHAEGLGKQVILKNHLKYKVKHRIDQ